MRSLFLLLCSLAAPGVGAASLFEAVCDGNAAIEAALSNGAPTDEINAAGESALHRLFRCGVAAEDPAFHHSARLLLDAGVPRDQIDQQGRTALHAALESVAGRAQAVNLYVDGARLLLARGALPDLADIKGVTPLHLAAAEPNATVTQLLLDLGADPQKKDQQGYTPLWYAAASDDNLDTFALLLARSDADSDNALLIELAQQSARLGHTDKLNLLLQQLPELTLDTDTASRHLGQSLWQGAPLPVLERLVAAGADPASLQTLELRDLAWRLAMLGKPDELSWLLAQGWDLSLLPNSGYPSLYFADADAVKLLLSAGADPNQRGDVSGTVLVPTAAANAEYPDAESVRSEARAQQLLAAGYRPHSDAQSQSDLQLAVRSDDLWLVRTLLERTPASDKTLDLLVPVALQRGRLPVVQTLLRQRPDMQPLPAHWLTDYLLKPEPSAVLVEALLVAGVDANSLHSSGDPALLLAARRQLWPLVSLLLRYGADPALSNAQGCTLRCYEWSMPEALQQQLAPDAEQPWQWPEINNRPSAFFALALAPLLVLWLITLAWRLALQRALWSASLWLLVSGFSAVLVGGALFFQCAPCVLAAAQWQIALTALIAVLGYGLCVGAALMRRANESA